MKLSVLLVDDDPDVLEWLEHALASSYEVSVADCAASALELLASRSFVVLVSDDRLGEGMRGLELCARARAANPELVCVLLTGYGEQHATADVDRVLTKPVAASDVCHAIDAAIVARTSTKR